MIFFDNDNIYNTNLSLGFPYANISGVFRFILKVQTNNCWLTINATMKRLCTKMEHVHVYKLKPRDLFELLIFWNDRPFLLKLKSVAPEQHFCILNPEPSKNQLNENVALERQFQFFKQFSMSHQSPNNNTKLYAKWHVKRRNRSEPCWLPIF